MNDHLADCINTALVTVESHLDHVERFLLRVSNTGPMTKLWYAGRHALVDVDEDELAYDG